MNQDTIAAVATPEGRGALGVVRISGPEALSVVAEISSAKEAFLRFRPREARLVHLLDSDGALLDQAIATPYRAPSSYTGEDMVELSCHGGTEVIRGVLERLLSLGARPALPGEFTQRAFLNGKMSLDEAEAVSQLIEARTRASARAATRILAGGLKRILEGFRKKLVHQLAVVESALDFAEEDLEQQELENLSLAVVGLKRETDRLLHQFSAGRFLREGASVVIAGAPNVGKSTLLNRLAGYDRAIVSPVSGTTRDTIDVALDLNGIPANFTDTAGLHGGGDEIEREGVRRAREIISSADLILWLVAPPDFTPPPDDFTKTDKLVTVINKCDLLHSDNENTNVYTQNSLFETPLRISSLTGEGLVVLRKSLSEHLLHGYDPGELLLVEQRHAHRLMEVSRALDAALGAFESSLGLEIIAGELHLALNALGEITGTVTSEDIIQEIFSSFCVGK